MKFKMLTIGKNIKKDDVFSASLGGEGEWTLHKCFYEEGTEYGEFYLWVNEQTHEAEITAKSIDYAFDLAKAFFKSMMNK